MVNRLATSQSPYLLQHAENPVDWYPWGDEAFEVARTLDRPVFLSVGYSSCHWCHVMAHESFEDEAVAKMLNENFVCIKVDREERPDVDETYMTAVQILTGRGGWPMSVFMTAEKKPFFTGTYWPKDDRGQQPGFLNICAQLASAWRTRRETVEKSAEDVAGALRETIGAMPPESELKLDHALIERATEALIETYDQQFGGFGAAPKFPPHTAIEFLLRFAMTPSKNEDLQNAAVTVALATLRSMVMGGIHDHVGGGFHRYSTDEKWLLPHFEKMLYDNALMLGNLAMGAGLAGELEPALAQMFARAAQGIIDWLMREMTSEDGIFYSALDADSEGEEGKFYTWTADELADILQHHAPVFMQAYGVHVEGNFADEASGKPTGLNILHLAEDLSAQFEQELEMLRIQRETRERPGLDDKSLIGWNGLMIGALADAGMWPLAQNALVRVLAAEKLHGTLPHLVTREVPAGEAFLDDYAYLTQGVLKLAICISFLEENQQAPAQAVTSEALFGLAARLGQEMVGKFYDEEKGGFFGSSDRHEVLFGKSKPVFDQPTPSANAIAIRCLLQLGDEARAKASLEALLGWMARAPQATEALHTTALMMFDIQNELGEEPEVELDLPLPAAPKQVTDVGVSISSREIQADGHGVGKGVITIDIPEGLHINSSTPPARWLIPTRVEVNGAKVDVEYPKATDDRYHGIVEIPFSTRLGAGESGIEFELVVGYQACTESECMEPREKTFGVVVFR